MPYPDHVPVAGLRFFPALFGSALLPTVYLIVCELGMTAWAGALAGFFMLLGELGRNSFYVDRNALVFLILYRAWVLFHNMKQLLNDLEIFIYHFDFI